MMDLFRDHRFGKKKNVIRGSAGRMPGNRCGTGELDKDAQRCKPISVMSSQPEQRISQLYFCLRGEKHDDTDQTQNK